MNDMPTPEVAEALATVVAVVSDYTALRHALAFRRAELGLSQLDADDIAGLSDGYTGKLEAGMKHLGDMSMPSLLGALGLRLMVVRDPAFRPRQSRKRHAPNGNRLRATGNAMVVA